MGILKQLGWDQNHLLTACLFLAPLSALLMTKSLSLIYTITLLSSVFLLIRKKNKWIVADKFYLGSILLYVFVCVLSGIVNSVDMSQTLSAIDDQLRLASIVFFIILLRNDAKLVKSFNVGIFCVLVIALLCAAYEFFVLDIARITLGHNAMYTGIMCMAFSIYAVGALSKHKNRNIALIFLVFINIMIQSMNLTRSAWLCMPLFLMYVFISFNTKFKKHLVGALIFALVFFGFVMRPNVINKAFDRVHLAKAEVDRCLSKGDCESSVGWRLVMWDNSLNMVKGKLWLGVGPDEYKSETLKLIDLGHSKSSDSIIYEHKAHSNYFTNIAEYGILGLILFVWVTFLMPIIYMKLSGSASLTSFVLLLSFAVMGLTASWAVSLKSVAMFNLLLAASFTLGSHSDKSSKVEEA